MQPDDQETIRLESVESEKPEDLLTWKELLLGSGVGLVAFVSVWLVIMETIVMVFHFMRDHVF